MKLTPQELDTFRHLSETELGQFLVSYMKRVQDYAYDCRNWDKTMTREGAEQAAKLLQELVINKIRTASGGNAVLNPHE